MVELLKKLAERYKANEEVLNNYLPFGSTIEETEKYTKLKAKNEKINKLIINIIIKL